MTDEFLHYLEQLGQLRELILVGEGDSEEADSLRDNMDSTWVQLSEKEKDYVRGLP